MDADFSIDRVKNVATQARKILSELETTCPYLRLRLLWERKTHFYTLRVTSYRKGHEALHTARQVSFTEITNYRGGNIITDALLPHALEKHAEKWVKDATCVVRLKEEGQAAKARRIVDRTSETLAAKPAN